VSPVGAWQLRFGASRWNPAETQILRNVVVWSDARSDRQTLIMAAGDDLEARLARVPGISLAELDDRATLLRRIDNKYTLERNRFLDRDRPVRA
jgi:hypothetical protein